MRPTSTRAKRTWEGKKISTNGRKKPINCNRAHEVPGREAVLEGCANILGKTIADLAEGTVHAAIDEREASQLTRRMPSGIRRAISRHQGDVLDNVISHGGVPADPLVGIRRKSMNCPLALPGPAYPRGNARGEPGPALKKPKAGDRKPADGG